MDEENEGQGAEIRNLFACEPALPKVELFESLLERPGLCIERIRGPVREPSKVYEQERDEWVALLRGEALLELEGEPAPRILGPGDCLLIPAGLRHRVLEASAEALWLAVHFQRKKG